MLENVGNAITRLPIDLLGLSLSCPRHVRYDAVAMATHNGALNILQLWASGGQTREPIWLKFGEQQQIRTTMTVTWSNVKILKIQNGGPSMLRFGGHIALSRWRPRALNTISGFAFVDIAAFRRSKSISKPILSTYLSWWLRYNYFRFLKNKRPPYWKSTFGFDFDHLPKICTLFCIRLSNFVQIEAPTAKIWRHIHFSSWRPRRLNTTSGFVSVDVTAFRRSKSYSKPNFGEISQMEAGIFLW